MINLLRRLFGLPLKQFKPDHCIVLIKSDFDIQDGKWIEDQYLSGQFCPIAKALKRNNMQFTSVCPDWIKWDRQPKQYIKGGFDQVKRCWKEIKSGNKETYIEVIQ